MCMDLKNSVDLKEWEGQQPHVPTPRYTRPPLLRPGPPPQLSLRHPRPMGDGGVVIAKASQGQPKFQGVLPKGSTKCFLRAEEFNNCVFFPQVQGQTVLGIVSKM